jgi:hypothetical protein
LSSLNTALFHNPVVANSVLSLFSFPASSQQDSTLF